MTTAICFQTLPSVQLNLAAMLLLWWLSAPIDHPVRLLWNARK